MSLYKQDKAEQMAHTKTIYGIMSVFNFKVELTVVEHKVNPYGKNITLCVQLKVFKSCCA